MYKDLVENSLYPTLTCESWIVGYEYHKKSGGITIGMF